MPAVLVEAGFINNDQDNRLFDERFEDLAQGIADGILETLDQTEAEEQKYPVRRELLQCGRMRNVCCRNCRKQDIRLSCWRRTDIIRCR